MCRTIKKFRVRGVLFIEEERGDGTVCLKSIHPYDETEYHWASRAQNGVWLVFRMAELLETIGRDTPLTAEEAAEYLLAKDKAAGLKPNMAYD